MADQRPQEKRFYGRRQSRPLNKTRLEVMETLFPKLAIKAESLPQDESLDPKALFQTPESETWLEIGFGNGERLAQEIRQSPSRNYIGAEPFINGMAAFLKDMNEDGKTDNIRVFMDDALLLCESLANETIDRIYILNPDPWHKKRHHKRRIVNPQNLDTFARILKPGGQFIMSSDVIDVTDWMLTHTVNHPAFEWTAKKADDWRTPPPGWITTRYETKGAKGAKIMTYLIFEKNLANIP